MSLKELCGDPLKFVVQIDVCKNLGGRCIYATDINHNFAVYPFHSSISLRNKCSALFGFNLSLVSKLLGVVFLKKKKKNMSDNMIHDVILGEALSLIIYLMISKIGTNIQASSFLLKWICLHVDNRFIYKQKHEQLSWSTSKCVYYLAENLFDVHIRSYPLFLFLFS